jgi:hypothetical protein
LGGGDNVGEPLDHEVVLLELVADLVEEPVKVVEDRRAEVGRDGVEVHGFAFFGLHPRT